MSKAGKIILILVVILLAVIIIAAALWFLFLRQSDDYYAVYLETGDLYFGTLSRFPYLSLSNVWYLRQNPQNQESYLLDFSKAVWGPENKIKLNKNKIVWMAEISKTSQLIPLLSGKQSSVPIAPSSPIQSQSNPNQYSENGNNSLQLPSASTGTAR